MLRAIGEVLPQAVAIAISPVPIILVILMLVSARARTNGPAFAAGWLIGSFVLAGVVALVADGADVDSASGSADGARVVQLVLGLVFIGLAIRAWRHRDRPDASGTSKLFSAVDLLSAPKAAAFGVTAAVANPKNLPLGISAGVAMAQAGTTGGTAVAVVAIFAIIASITIIVPIVVVFVTGQRSREPLDNIKSWLLANNAAIMTVLFIVLGARMLGDGLTIGD